MSETLAKALLAFHKAAPDVHTDSTGNFNNSFLGLPGLMDAIRGPLAANGLVLIQKPTILDNGAPGLVTKILHESGEEEQSVMPLLLDKQNPQGLGSALTYARRQMALAFLGLAPDADDDAHAASNPAPKKTVVGVPPAQFAPPPQHTEQPAVAAPPPVVASNDPGSVVLTFGKHKDTSIKNVPRPYLEWWIAQEPPKTDAQRVQRAAAELFLLGATDDVLAGVGGADSDIPFRPTV